MRVYVHGNIYTHVYIYNITYINIYREIGDVGDVGVCTPLSIPIRSDFAFSARQQYYSAYIAIIEQ